MQICKSFPVAHIHKTLLIAAGFTLTAAASAFAETAPPPPPPQPPATYIKFLRVDSELDFGEAGTIGDPRFSGNFASEEGVIEIDSNVAIQVNYLTGPDMRNSTHSLPTTFQFAVQGLVHFDGMNISSPGKYTNYGDLPGRGPERAGTILYEALAPKGLKARVVVERHGLNDRAGDYETNIVFSWYHF